MASREVRDPWRASGRPVNFASAVITTEEFDCRESHDLCLVAALGVRSSRAVAVVVTPADVRRPIVLATDPHVHVLR